MRESRNHFFLGVLGGGGGRGPLKRETGRCRPCVRESGGGGAAGGALFFRGGGGGGGGAWPPEEGHVKMPVSKMFT